MPVDLTSIQLSSPTIEALERQKAEGYAARIRKIGLQQLSDLTSRLGFIDAGELRLGNRILPGGGFSGIRMAYPDSILTYDSETWNFVGVEDDVLQVGIRATDGKFVGGAGKVGIDKDGIKLASGIGSLARLAWYTDISDAANLIKASIVYNSGNQTFQIGAWEDSSEIQLIFTLANTLYSPTITFFEDPGDLHQYMLWDSKNFSSIIIDFLGSIKIVGKEDASHTDLTETFFNGLGYDLDHRIESENNINMFFLDGSTDRIGVGLDTPLATFDINGDLRVRGFVDLLEASAPGTPASGYGRFYVKTDSLPYFKDDGGVENSLVIGNATDGTLLVYAAYYGEPALTDGMNISWNVLTDPTAKVTLEGNRTLDNPTNMKAGATYIIRIIQDGTGTRTLAYGGAYKWSGGTVPVLSTGINDIDIISFYSDGASMFGTILKDFS